MNTHRIIHSLLIATASALACRGAGEDHNSSGTRAFKELLSSPPALAELVVREKLPPIRNHPVPLDVGIRDSTNYAEYVVRWQSNAISVASVPSSAQPSAPKVAFALWNDEFWFFDAGTNAFVYTLEHERARKGKVSPPYDAAWYRVTRYGEVLNLGLSHIWPGTVQWKGDQFSASGIADKRPMSVIGRITSVDNGRPAELRVAYSNDTAVANYRIHYEYRPKLDPVFPAVIRLFYEAPKHEIEYRSYEVLSLHRAREALPSSSFLERPSTLDPALPVAYLSNNLTYVRLKSGRLLPVGGVAPSLSLSRHDFYRNRYYYTVVALMSVCLVALIVKEHRTKTKQTP